MNLPIFFLQTIYLYIYIFIIHLTPSRLTGEARPRASGGALGVPTHPVKDTRHVNSYLTNQLYLSSAYVLTII